MAVVTVTSPHPLAGGHTTSSPSAAASAIAAERSLPATTSGRLDHLPPSRLQRHDPRNAAPRIQTGAKKLTPYQRVKQLLDGILHVLATDWKTIRSSNLGARGVGDGVRTRACSSQRCRCRCRRVAVHNAQRPLSCWRCEGLFLAWVRETPLPAAQAELD